MKIIQSVILHHHLPKIFSTLFLLIAVILVCGCTGKDNKVLKSEGTSLLNGQWIIQKIDFKEVEKEKVGNEMPYLVFQLKDSSVSGFMGCNTLSGKIDVTGDEITFKKMSMSKMYCLDVPYEKDIINVIFSKVKLKYKIASGTLSLLENDEEIMILKKSN
jgi:heat shock protein HslJ